MMKTLLKITTILGLFLFTAQATEVWSADVRIDSIDANIQNQNEYNCNVIIKSSHDDDAKSVKTVILLAPLVKYNNGDYTIENIAPSYLSNPLTSKAKSDHLNVECHLLQRSPKPYNSTIFDQIPYIECNLGNLSTEAKLSISLQGEVLPNDKPDQDYCSAFIYSLTPDYNPENNFLKSE